MTGDHFLAARGLDASRSISVEVPDDRGVRNRQSVRHLTGPRNSQPSEIQL
jgi:hypothetical protein